MNDSVKIRGYCPMGCGETLAVRLIYVAAIDEKLAPAFIYCTNPLCPKLEAVQEILDDPETEHVVTFNTFMYSMKHPLRERINGELLSCRLGEHLDEFGDQYVQGGVNRPHAQFGDPIPLNVPHRMWFEGTGEDATLQWEPIT